MEIDKENREARMILSLITINGKRILEVGCGKGRITKLLKTPDNFVLAIDPDGEKVRFAQEIVPTAEFLVATIHDLNPRSTALFDIIVFSMSLHHVGYTMTEKLQALRKAKTLLRPRGQILVIEPTRQSTVTTIVKEFYLEESTLILQAQQAIHEFDCLNKKTFSEKLAWRYAQLSELITHFSEITNTHYPFRWWQAVIKDLDLPQADIEIIDVVAVYLLE